MISPVTGLMLTKQPLYARSRLANEGYRTACSQIRALRAQASQGLARIKTTRSQIGSELPAELSSPPYSVASHISSHVH